MTKQFTQFEVPGRLGYQEADTFGYVAIAAVWIAMAILVNPIGDFPLNDDWIYATAVKSVVERGYYQVPIPSTANVLSQVYWGALFCLPFGFSFTALRFSTLALGLVGVLCLYALVREIGGNRKTAVISAFTLAVNPLYFGLANSFMTDVPFISVSLVSTYLLVRGLRRQSSGSLLLGIGFAFVSILIRQFGLVLLLAFSLAYPIKNGLKVRTFAIGLSAVLAGTLLHLAYQRWLIETGRTPALDFANLRELIPTSLLHFAKTVTRESFIAFTYIGVFMLPVAILPLLGRTNSTMSARSRTRRFAALSALGVCILVVLLWTHRMMPSSENVLIKTGLGPLTLRDTFILDMNYPRVPLAAAISWMVLTVLGVAAGCRVIYAVALALREMTLALRTEQSRRRNWIQFFVVAMASFYWLILLVLAERYKLFDRYLLLFVPLLCLLIISEVQAGDVRATRARTVLCALILALYGGFGVAATHDYLAWNRARWTALQGLLTEGIPPSRIDGGFEFNGWFLYKSNYERTPGKSYWWVDDDEYIVASGPLPRYRELRRYTFNRWLPLTESTIRVLQKTHDD